MTGLVLGLPEHKVRVIAPDVAAAFGSKIYCTPRETALVFAARKSAGRSSGRPSAARVSFRMRTAATT